MSVVGSFPCRPYKTVTINIEIIVLTNIDLANYAEAPTEINILFANDR